MGYQDYTYSVTDKATADGAQVVTFVNERAFKNHQIKVSVSAEPTAGTLAVQIKSPGADGFDLIGTIDLTATTERIMQFAGNAEAIRFVPLLLDTGKTFSVYGYIS